MQILLVAQPNSARRVEVSLLLAGFGSAGVLHEINLIMLYKWETSDMSTCIYLKKSEPNVTFTAREHIIPAGIGGIHKLELGYVSDEINNAFSKLELNFMRNSITALPRQFVGPGKRGDLSEKKGSKSNIHIMTNNENDGDVKLGYIKLSKPYHIPQILIYSNDTVEFCFNQTDGEYGIQLTDFINNLRGFKDSLNLIVNEKVPKHLVILGYSDSKWIMAKNNININIPYENIITKLINDTKIHDIKPSYDSTKVTSHQHLVFDITQFYRVCSKIVFNFLASSKGVDYVLQGKFDPIRNWIVSGGDNEYTRHLDNCDGEKIMSKISLPNQAHCIIICKFDNSLIGLLSLYGGATYILVKLCGNYEEKDIYFHGYICDWLNKKEYDYFDYINLLNQEEDFV